MKKEKIYTKIIRIRLKESTYKWLQNFGNVSKKIREIINAFRYKEKKK